MGVNETVETRYKPLRLCVCSHPLYSIINSGQTAVNKWGDAAAVRVILLLALE